MVKRPSQSVVRSLRLDNELNDYLLQEAKKSNISVSALASQIFTAYRDRYYFVEKLNPVAITPGNLKQILDCVPDEDLVRIAPTLATKLCLYRTHIYNEVKGGGTLDWCLTTFLPASHWFQCSHSKEGYMITHQMGPKWTLFLARFLSAMIHIDAGVVPEVDVDKEIIVIRNWT